MSEDHTQQVLETISSEESLALYLADSPQAVLMPFAKDHTRCYVAIILHVVEQAANLEVLSYICRRVVQLLRATDSLSHLGGIEIMPCLLRGVGPRRILRLSILADALERAEHLVPDDLVRSVPFEGCTCYVYMKEIVGEDE